LKNWTLAQSPCGFMPEFFGQDWRVSWGENYHQSLLAEALHEMYFQTGDAELVRFIYPTLKRSEQWLACEIDDSPYWERYYPNIRDWAARKAQARKGAPWTARGELDYYRRFAELAKIAGDEDYQRNLMAKLKACRQMLDGKKPLDEGRPLDQMGMQGLDRRLYWASETVDARYIERLQMALADPDILGTRVPMPSEPLTQMRAGDGWDFGASVTSAFFLIEGLFRAGYPEAAVGLLFRQMDASFIETSEGPMPSAPEYWSVRGEPWGCVDYAWNGLLNMLVIERICGVRPSVPERRLTIQPCLPEIWNAVEVTVPLPDGWITVKHTIDRQSDRIALATTVTNCPYAVALRIPVPAGFESAELTVDDQPVTWKKEAGHVATDVTGRRTFEARIVFRRATITR
jgi:hypothetical protein